VDAGAAVRVPRPLQTKAISTTSTGGKGVFWCSERAPATTSIDNFPVSSVAGAGNCLI
jgi:hypothetical protein